MTSIAGTTFDTTLTHIPTGGSIRTRISPEDPRITETELTPTRIVLIAFATKNPKAGTRYLEQTYQWPHWNHPQPPGPTAKWSAVFSTRTRTYAGVTGRLADGTTISIAPPTAATSTHVGHAHRHPLVVLCGAFHTPTTLAKLSDGIASKTLHAVFARASLR
ncbi:hypothetical protein ACIQCG_39075 [Streptomyces noursei]|uniref:hypothetical protein n=1 Tax=Streptomyces noursei TaxID=1971 RepID=UPI0037F51622